MKKTMLATATIILLGFSMNACAEANHQAMHEMMMQQNQMSAPQVERTSLHLPPAMKQHQLSNMRSHLEAVQSIIGLLTEDKYVEASAVAYSKLGATPEMLKMCNMFANEDFKKLGLAFHKSGDDLGDALKTGNLKQSLQALHTTMNYCVSCHATYRQ
ncbi:MAG: cytochrome C [Zetaproteobacteria bacterium CG_4_9_14_3_um_filter_49_83]|nr:MAG: cytochrome C [Zetaproteobacteria bacterium CG1_02_49_23]PIQ30094.1 MAG: cytochrome C [Zetaproteobacteria bacterium CG17_big_fil_post_rev_8_21_14_2_50_50_13]PIV31536.1 MAG: cytochrome C [Zetaproteobacteria bacterium CG02_land_8_20_14_3_00_50_9]PIY55958.1 MAG: cytochrome C [Zetaproteobacteria bacterium CG_4_10_14_0_8_um_filter_49_80]PJA36366.1 MAG: cytochrome C [Zetaproteobacteria bacterium CG_4_9_14_3_um_filter_49_83]